MEIASSLVLLAIGWLIYDKLVGEKIFKSKDTEEAKVLDFKQKEASQSVEQLKKHLAEQQTGKELTNEEIMDYWKKDK